MFIQYLIVCGICVFSLFASPVLGEEFKHNNSMSSSTGSSGSTSEGTVRETATAKDLEDYRARKCAEFRSKAGLPITSTANNAGSKDSTGISGQQTGNKLGQEDVSRMASQAYGLANPGSTKGPVDVLSVEGVQGQEEAAKAIDYLSKCLGSSSQVFSQLEMAFKTDKDLLSDLKEARKSGNQDKVKSLMDEITRRGKNDDLFTFLKKAGAGNGDDAFLYEQLQEIRKLAKEGKHDEANRLASSLTHSMAMAKRDEFLEKLNSKTNGFSGLGKDDLGVDHFKVAARVERALNKGEKVDLSDITTIKDLKPETAAANMQKAFDKSTEFHSLVSEYNNAKSDAERQQVLAKIKAAGWEDLNPQWFATQHHLESDTSNAKADGSRLNGIKNGARAALDGNKLENGQWGMGNKKNAWGEAGSQPSDAIHVVNEDTLGAYLNKTGNPAKDGHGNPAAQFAKLEGEQKAAAQTVAGAYKKETGAFDESAFEKMTEQQKEMARKVRLAEKSEAGDGIKWNKWDEKPKQQAPGPVQTQPAEEAPPAGPNAGQAPGPTKPEQGGQQAPPDEKPSQPKPDKDKEKPSEDKPKPVEKPKQPEKPKEPEKTPVDEVVDAADGAVNKPYYDERKKGEDLERKRQAAAADRAKKEAEQKAKEEAEKNKDKKVPERTAAEKEKDNRLAVRKSDLVGAQAKKTAAESNVRELMSERNAETCGYFDVFCWNRKKHLEGEISKAQDEVIAHRKEIQKLQGEIDSLIGEGAQ